MLIHKLEANCQKNKNKPMCSVGSALVHLCIWFILCPSALASTRNGSELVRGAPHIYWSVALHSHKWCCNYYNIIFLNWTSSLHIPKNSFVYLGIFPPFRVSVYTILAPALQHIYKFFHSPIPKIFNVTLAYWRNRRLASIYCCKYKLFLSFYSQDLFSPYSRQNPSFVTTHLAIQFPYGTANKVGLCQMKIQL